MATFGKTSIGGTGENVSAGFKQVFEHTLGEDGRVSKLTIYLQNSVATQAMKGIVYADSAGAPGALIAVTAAYSHTSGSPDGWYDLPAFPGGLVLKAGVYHIGIHADTTDAGCKFAWDTNVFNRDWSADTYSDGPTDPFGAPGGTDNFGGSIYATYDALKVGQLAKPNFIYMRRNM